VSVGYSALDVVRKNLAALLATVATRSHFCRETGERFQLQLVNRKAPIPGTRQARLRLVISGVIPTDWKSVVGRKPLKPCLSTMSFRISFAVLNNRGSASSEHIEPATRERPDAILARLPRTLPIAKDSAPSSVTTSGSQVAAEPGPRMSAARPESVAIATRVKLACRATARDKEKSKKSDARDTPAQHGPLDLRNLPDRGYRTRLQLILPSGGPKPERDCASALSIRRTSSR